MIFKLVEKLKIKPTILAGVVFSLMLGAFVVSPLAGVAGASGQSVKFPNNFATKDIQKAICDGIDNCDTGGKSGGLNKVVNFIVNLLVVLLGVASVIMLVIGGFKYTTSNGDSNSVASAKSTILYALVGLVVAALAKPIVGLVLSSIT